MNTSTVDITPQAPPTTPDPDAVSSGYRTYVLVALAVVGFMCAVDRVVISMFMEPIKKEFGLSDTELGLLTGLAFSVMGGLASVPLARWADRGSRKWIIGGSFVAWTLMTAASGAAAGFVQLFAARIGVGIGEAGCIPATHSMLGDYYPRHLRPRALAVHSAGTYLARTDSHYAAAYAKVGRLQALAARHEVGPEVVEQALEHAMNARRPRARYVVPGRMGFLLFLTRFVPTFLLDRIVSRIMGLEG